MADSPSSLEWPADKLYEACGALLAAKEKHREEHFGSISMSDFVGVYFEHVHGSRLDAQRQATSFARGVQAHWTHPEFGARIYTFGLLCGLLLFEGDSPNAATLNKAPLGASAEACTVILDALRALLNGPLFQPPPPLLPPAAKGGAAYDKSASTKPWRMTSTTSPDASTSPAAAFSSSNLISHYSADLALALNPPTSATTSRRGSPSLTSPSPSSSPPLPSACVVPFQRDIVRRAFAQTAAEARAKARIRSGALHLQGGNNYDIGLPKPLMKPDSHASTGEGRLRQVLMRELPEPALDALCDTIWADATPLLHIASSTSMQRRSSSPSLTLEPEEVLVNLDGFMERVLTAWLSVKLLSSSFGVQRRKNGLTGGNGAPEYQDYERDVSNDRMTHEQQQQLQRQKQADKAAVAAAAAHEEAVRLANQERAAKKKALEELALGEKIEYEEASAVAFDWALVFDSDGNDVSFEEARALFRHLKTEPCVTLTLRFLTRPTITTRCAPADTIAQVKARIGSRLKKQPSSSSSSSSSSSLIGRERGGAQNKRHDQSNKPVTSSGGVQTDRDEDLVMVQFGVELPSHSTVEACGLHNNASVEMIELDLWKSMLKLRLDEKPDATRGKPGAAAHRAYTTGAGTSRGAESNASAASRANSPLFSPPPGRSTSNNKNKNKAKAKGGGNGSVFLNTSSVDSFGFGAGHFERGDLPLPRPPDPAVAQALLSGGRPPYRPSSNKDDGGGVGEGLRKKSSSSLGPMETLRFKLRTGGKPWQPPN